MFIVSSPMDEVILNADTTVLAEIVRITQKHRLRGGGGGWKDFVDSNDGRYGASYDPRKKSKDILVAFLQTFQEKDHKFLDKLITRVTEHKAIEQFNTDFPGQESPQQRLVCLTMEHPLFPRCYSFPSYDEGWMVLPLGEVSKAMKSKTMIAIDCEMVLCKDGTDAVVKVCAVDEKLEIKLDKLVNPNKAVADYRIDITGISAEDLEGVTCSLADIQKSIKKLLSHGAILVGHSLHNDLRALKIDHPQVIDTAYIFKYSDLQSGSPSLNNLCKSVLGFAVREEGETHDCLNDAKAAMRLVLAKLEHGFDDPISVIDNNLSDSDLAKLRLHRIPVEVPYEELLKLFPESYNVDVKNNLKIQGSTYSTFAVFKDAREAEEAFERIEAPERRDSIGRRQKNVFLEISSGKSISFYVREMRTAAPLNGCDQSNKRVSQDKTSYSKRQRTSLDLCDHVKEMERLKQELRQREDEIFELQKIVYSLDRKNGW